MPIAFSQSRLFTSHIDAFKVEAANAVLARLGKDVFDDLKQDLQKEFKIELTKHTSYTLSGLNLALQKLLGEDSARLLMRTIEGEIERLANDDMR
jgi:flagellar motor switch protein FliG